MFGIPSSRRSFYAAYGKLHILKIPSLSKHLSSQCNDKVRSGICGRDMFSPDLQRLLVLGYRWGEEVRFFVSLSHPT